MRSVISKCLISQSWLFAQPVHANRLSSLFATLENWWSVSDLHNTPLDSFLLEDTKYSALSTLIDRRTGKLYRRIAKRCVLYGQK